MNVLIIGSGGREHALAWKIKQSPLVEKIYCVPGNAGIARLAEVLPLKLDKKEQILKFAKENSIELTVVGPEQPLSDGIVDLFLDNGLRIFGPTKQAAQIETSKVFAKEFMRKHNIPTANFRTFNRKQKFEAERYINEIPPPIVLKVDGLAAGKGVLICESKETAITELDNIFLNNKFGEAGNSIVIEDFMIGEELSVLVITDGENFVVLPPAHDYKKILDGDKGKNTGGMGAYAPVPFVDEELINKIKRTIIKPTISGLKSEGIPFKGCLYFGLMLTETGPRVVEYNSRFGDPETQVILPLIENDLVDLMLASIDNRINKVKIRVSDLAAVCVILSSHGYPDDYEVGKKIYGLEKKFEDVLVFHAGTKLLGDDVITSGGRVLGITSFGKKEKFKQVISNVYHAVEQITFDGAYYRSDIGKNVTFL